MKAKGSVLHHIALNVTDIEEKINLFKNVFGMEITLVDGEPDHPRQVWFDSKIQLISQPDSPACTIAHIALTSRELESDVAGSEEYGGSILPKGDNWLRFPDHLVIELMPAEEDE